MAKTKEFTDLVAKTKDTTKLGTQMEKTFNDVYNAASGTFAQQVLAGAKAVCRKYNLVLYEGTLDGALTKLELGP